MWTTEVQRGEYLQEWLNVSIVQNSKYTSVAYREGGVKPPLTPEIPKCWQSWTGLQIEWKIFSVTIPTS